jgi:hypothetical protein
VSRISETSQCCTPSAAGKMLSFATGTSGQPT